MSDAPQGPGWWQASDGRWYPPQPVAPPPPQPYAYAPAAPTQQWGPPPPQPYAPVAKPSGGKGCLIAALVVGAICVVGLVAIVLFFVRAADEVGDRVEEIVPTERDGIITNSPNDENPPQDDVDLTDCVLDEQGLMTTEGTVTNNSSKPSTYFITVSFETDGGDTQLATGIATIVDLGPGQRTDLRADSFQAPEGDFTCRVTLVQRVAS